MAKQFLSQRKTGPSMGCLRAGYNREVAATRLFQIWLQPDRHGVAPGWRTRQFPREGSLVVLASGGSQDDKSVALTPHADAAVLAGTLVRRRNR